MKLHFLRSQKKKKEIYHWFGMYKIHVLQTFQDVQLVLQVEPVKDIYHVPELSRQ